MKTIFIALLIAALGVAAYFYFTKKQHSHSADPKLLIAGKWKIDSVTSHHSQDSSFVLALVVSDSNLHNYEFSLSKGLIIQTLNGRVEDTSNYRFDGDDKLLAWSNTGSSKSRWIINQLDSVKLVVTGKDSIVFSFRRIH